MTTLHIETDVHHMISSYIGIPKSLDLEAHLKSIECIGEQIYEAPILVPGARHYKAIISQKRDFLDVTLKHISGPISSTFYDLQGGMHLADSAQLQIAVTGKDVRQVEELLQTIHESIPNHFDFEIRPDKIGPLQGSAKEFLTQTYDCYSDLFDYFFAIKDRFKITRGIPSRRGTTDGMSLALQPFFKKGFPTFGSQAYSMELTNSFEVEYEDHKLELSLCSIHANIVPNVVDTIYGIVLTETQEFENSSEEIHTQKSFVGYVTSEKYLLFGTSISDLTVKNPEALTPQLFGGAQTFNTPIAQVFDIISENFVPPYISVEQVENLKYLVKTLHHN